MKSKKLLYLFIFCFTSLSIQAQVKKNKKLEKLLTKIKKQEYLFTDYQLTSKTKKFASKLFKVANETELIEVSKMDCKLCFVYPLWVLSKKNLKMGHKIYNAYTDEKYKDEDQTTFIFTEVNQLKKSKGCVIILYGVDSFLYDIFEKGEYIKDIK